MATLPGLDGRKMSKSYDNTIALFADSATLKKQIMGLVTDSKAPGEAEGRRWFGSVPAVSGVRHVRRRPQPCATAFATGIAWGEAKQQLFEVIDAEIAPMRARTTR